MSLTVLLCLFLSVQYSNSWKVCLSLFSFKAIIIHDLWSVLTGKKLIVDFSHICSHCSYTKYIQVWNWHCYNN